MNSNKAPKTQKLAWVAAVVVGSVFIGTALFGLQDFEYWQDHGVATKGTVLNKYIEEECQSGGSSNTTSCLDNHYFTYQYTTAEGGNFEGNDSMNEAFWHAHGIGSDIAVLYLSNQPSKSSVAHAFDPEGQKSLWMLLYYAGGALCLLGVVFLLRAYIRPN